MHHTHSRHRFRWTIARPRQVDVLNETKLGERPLRRLENLLLFVIVTASYGGAWLIEVLMRGARRTFTVRANQGRLF